MKYEQLVPNGFHVDFVCVSCSINAPRFRSGTLLLYPFSLSREEAGFREAEWRKVGGTHGRSIHFLPREDADAVWEQNNEEKKDQEGLAFHEIDRVLDSFGKAKGRLAGWICCWMV